MTLDELGIDYRVIPTTDDVILTALKSIAAAKDKPAQPAWDDYWTQSTKLQPPSYLKRTSRFRYRGGYIEAANDTELRYFTALKTRYFAKYVTEHDAIAEFGCGSGSNLAQLASMVPSAKLFGFDWSPAAVAAASTVATTAVFDMTDPKPVDIPRGAAIFTSGAMEQLGDRFHNFFTFLLALRPTICVHIEPIIELYDESMLFDYLAAMYHRKRGYLGRYLTELRANRHVRVLEVLRTGFGNQYNEGYSIIAWQPRNDAWQPRNDHT